MNSHLKCCNEDVDDDDGDEYEAVALLEVMIGTSMI